MTRGLPYEKKEETTFEELYTKKLKRSLDSWREVVLIFNEVLLWKKPWHPWLIIFVVTLLFFELLYYSLSFLTTLSLTCLLVTLFDYVGPSVISAFWKQENWSTSKERELEDICRSLSDTTVIVKNHINCLQEMRTKKPNKFYLAMAVFLGLSAWLGNSVDNLFITYLLVLGICLLPGLLHYGILQKAYMSSMQKVATFLHRLSATPKKAK